VTETDPVRLVGDGEIVYPRISDSQMFIMAARPFTTSSFKLTK